MAKYLEEGDVLIVHRQFQVTDHAPHVNVGTIFVVVNIDTKTGDIDIVADRFQICWKRQWEEMHHWLRRADGARWRERRVIE